ALSGGGAAKSLVPVRPIARSAAAEWSAERPQELMPITSNSMPRLYSAIAPKLQALGAGEVRPYLSMRGGVEAFLLEYDELIIGAGALARFCAPELTYLIALALALGDRSRQLRHSGPVEGLESAAQVAFDAVPCSLAACRVLGQLDERVRGSDPGSSERNDV